MRNVIQRRAAWVARRPFRITGGCTFIVCLTSSISRAHQRAGCMLWLGCCGGLATGLPFSFQ